MIDKKELTEEELQHSAGGTKIKEFSIPDVIGKNEVDATMELLQLDLTCESCYVSSPMPRDTVTDIDPIPGIIVRVPCTVKLFISDGNGI